MHANLVHQCYVLSGMTEFEFAFGHGALLFDREDFNSEPCENSEVFVRVAGHYISASGSELRLTHISPNPRTANCRYTRLAPSDRRSAAAWRAADQACCTSKRFDGSR